MSKKRRLQFKDLDALRFFAFLPVFLYSTVYILKTGESEFMVELSNGLSKVVQNSLDFFFFLSSFLLTSHALREYKYRKSFGIKAFYVRRTMRILPLFIIALLFAFLIHPWIIETLKLTSITVPDGYYYLLMIPNYFADFSNEQFIYLVIIQSIYMFIQFYFVWGLILKFFIQQIKYVGYFFIAIGVFSRVYHILLNTPYSFDTLSAGIPIGIGAIIAHTIRNEERTVELIKHTSKATHLFVYIIGLLLVGCGYLFLGNTYAAAFIPLLTVTFYGYVCMEQTYGKHSLFKLRDNKLISRLGRISYGFVIYHSLIAVIMLISVESLEFSLGSLSTQLGVIILTFMISWLVADLSYTWFERPILAIKKEFKRS
ncbi:MAG: acyltransferase family protein [Crocinitomicaceae bacterium]